MAFFIGGTTYQPGGQVTDTNLNALITAAIPQLLNRDHFASDSKIVTVAAGKTASPAAGELCWDSGVGVLFVFDGSNWIGIAPQSLRIFTAQSTISINDLVVLDPATTNSVKTNANAAGLDEVVGVARTNATAGQTVLVQTDEFGLVSCTSGAVNLGEYLVKSTTPGKAGVASSAGNGFAIALSSKGGGSEGTVTALLGKKTPGQVSATFSSYGITAVGLTLGQWYDVPNAAGMGSVTQTGSNRMRLDITTSRVNQPVTFSALGVKLLTATIAHRIEGIRFVLNASTVVESASTKGTTADMTPNATGEEESLGLNTVIYQKASSYEMLTRGMTVHFTVPTAGSHHIGLQFLAGTTNTYTLNNDSVTATLTAVVH